MPTANTGPNLFHQSRAVSWHMAIPRSASRSSTFTKDSGYRTYIITIRRITSGDELKYRNGLAGFFLRGFQTPCPHHPYQQVHLLLQDLRMRWLQIHRVAANTIHF